MIHNYVYVYNAASDGPWATDLDTRCKFSKHVTQGDLEEVEEILLRANNSGSSSKKASAELLEGVGDGTFPALVLAALASSAEMVRLLVREGAKLDSRSWVEGEVTIPPGSTPLHLAAAQGRLEVVLALLEAGACPNARDSRENTPMTFVTRFHDPEHHAAITWALLEAGADPLARGWGGATAFHVAAGRGCVEVVDMLLERAPSCLNQPTANGATALYLAATEPGLDYMVSHLLSRGATNESLLGNGSCPLTGAVHYALESMVRLILREGYGAVGGPLALPRAIHLASAKDLPRTLHMLLGAEGGDDAGKRRFWSTCVYYDLSISPLHRAIASDAVGTVSVLLQAGAANDGVPVNRIFNQYNHEKTAVFLPRTPKRDQAKKAAVRRTVARAPAFRARSWAMPVAAAPAAAAAVPAAAEAVAKAYAKTAAGGAGGEGGGNNKPFFVFGAGRNKTTPPLLRVRIYRPSRRAWLVGLIGR